MAQTYNCVINSCPLSILECNPLEALSALSVCEGSSLNISIFILLVWLASGFGWAQKRPHPGELQAGCRPEGLQTLLLAGSVCPVSHQGCHSPLLSQLFSFLLFPALLITPSSSTLSAFGTLLPQKWPPQSLNTEMRVRGFFLKKQGKIHKSTHKTFGHWDGHVKPLKKVADKISSCFFFPIPLWGALWIRMDPPEHIFLYKDSNSHQISCSFVTSPPATTAVYGSVWWP